MQTIDECLWNGLTATLFTNKVMSFQEFLESNPEMYSHLFPSLKRAFSKVGPFPRQSEIYLQTPIGSGKSIYADFIIAYRVYLFMNLNCPWKFLDHSSCTDYRLCFTELLGNPKMLVNGFENFLEDLPMFVKAETMKDFQDYLTIDDKIIYFYNDDDSEILFRKGKNELRTITVTKTTDLLGINPVISYFNVENAPLDPETSESIYDLYDKLFHRFRSRFYSRLLIPLLLVSKAPNNLFNDRLDIAIQDFENDTSKDAIGILVERLEPRWKRNLENLQDCVECDCTINLRTAKVSNTHNADLILLPGDEFTTFPKLVDGLDLEEMAKKTPTNFIRDFLGLPLINDHFNEDQILLDLQKIVELMQKNHVEIAVTNFGTYLQVPGKSAKIRL